MSTDHEEEVRAARLTAHALGQTDEAERAKIEAEMAVSAQVRQEVEAVRSLAGQLKAAVAAAPQPGPSAGLREAIQRRLSEIAPANTAAAGDKVRPWWRSRLAAFAAAAACLAAIAVPIASSTNFFGSRAPRKLARQTSFRRRRPHPLGQIG